MTGGQHTPGPWRVRENPRNNPETCDLSICGDIFVLAEITGPQYEHQFPNAYLMAGAPELLEVAQRILDRGYVSRHIEEERADHEALTAAIAKATGNHGDARLTTPSQEKDDV